MQTNKYQAFIKIAELHSITKAAKELNYTQSNVSQIVQSMENELNMKLLIRNNEKVILTEAAERLLPYMRNIIENEQLLFAAANLMNGIEIGSIRMGTYISMVNAFLAKSINLFSSAYPKIDISLIEANTSEMKQLLKDRQIDFCMGVGEDFKEYEFLPLFRDHLVAILPKGHPLSKKESIRPEELFQYPYISTEIGSEPYYMKIANRCKTYPTISLRAKSEISIITMVSHNLGVSIISDLFLIGNSPDVEIRRLDCPDNYREMGVSYYSKDLLSPASQKFISLIQDNIHLLLKSD